MASTLHEPTDNAAGLPCMRETADVQTTPGAAPRVHWAWIVLPVAFLTLSGAALCLVAAVVSWAIPKPAQHIDELEPVGTM